MNTLDKISALLQNKNLKQKDLTSFLGLKETSYGDWKNGRNSSYLKYIVKIAEFLNVSTDYLLGNDNVKVFDDNDNLVVIDDETRDIIDTLRTKPEMKILFSVSKKATKEDIEQAVKIIKALSDK